MGKPGAKKWSEMSTGQRVGVVLLGVLQITLLIIAVTDLARRPAAQVRGSKRMWLPVMGINFFGPASYLLFGRLPPVDASPAPPAVVPLAVAA